ncbi:hypothetical protein [Candidatus Poriferisocius sp.]|uniref:hypothetical protein n=1 Tax=Candidatus Poriferisocius sp. TaxID=3101276 RepID=UPI003B58D1E9
MSVGTQWKILGEEFTTGIDEQSPVFVCEANFEREHCTIDVLKLTESLFGFSFWPDDWDDLGIEMWFHQERIVVDTSATQPLVDADPDLDMGPLAPGVFFIDLTALGAGSSEFMDAVSGSSTPDLREMAESLPAALTTIEQTSTDPPTFVGTTTSARLIEALGGDAEADALCEVAPLGMPSLRDLILARNNFNGLDELIAQFYETNTAEVVVELDDRGLLSVLWTKEDFSGLFSIIAEYWSLNTELSEQERQEAQEAIELFESAEFIVATRVAYESDADLEVPLPPPTAEDRTEEWREFFPECG